MNVLKSNLLAFSALAVLSAPLSGFAGGAKSASMSVLKCESVLPEKPRNCDNDENCRWVSYTVGIVENFELKVTIPEGAPKSDAVRASEVSMSGQISIINPQNFKNFPTWKGPMYFGTPTAADADAGIKRIDPSNVKFERSSFDVTVQSAPTREEDSGLWFYDQLLRVYRGSAVQVDVPALSFGHELGELDSVEITGSGSQMSVRLGFEGFRKYSRPPLEKEVWEIVANNCRYVSPAAEKLLKSMNVRPND